MTQEFCDEVNEGRRATRGKSDATDSPSTVTSITTRWRLQQKNKLYYYNRVHLFLLKRSFQCLNLYITNVRYLHRNCGGKQNLFCFFQTAVFTPAFGSVTNVRINSCMTTPQVLRVLLNKFKIENSPDDFALYLVHTSGGECDFFLFLTYTKHSKEIILML